MYQIIKSDRSDVIVRDQDGIRVSFGANPANSDYQAYLAWLAEGNQPEEAGA